MSNICHQNTPRTMIYFSLFNIILCIYFLLPFSDQNLKMEVAFMDFKMKCWYAILAVSVICFMLLSTIITDGAPKQVSAITYFNTMNETRTSQKREKRLLMWTPFLANNLSLEIFTTRLQTCRHKCSITDDRKLLESADAVMFHQFDLWPREVNWDIGTRVTIKLPERRRQDQVWSLWNLEPPVNIFGDFRVLNGLFNWTVWYRKDSTFWWPYGAKDELNETEMQDAAYTYKHRNYFREKSKGICGRISNCADPALRYKLVQRLQNYLDIDMFGGCYDRPASDDEINSYKFYLGFENSNCKDYATEKYWGALHREQIPIVNWRHGIAADIAIPGSYINIYDFSTVKIAAQYIDHVLKNETLYNSYFDWKLKYANKPLATICSFCEALHTRIVPAQVYSRIDLWLRNDTCQQVTFWSNKLGYFLHTLWEYGLW